MMVAVTVLMFRRREPAQERRVRLSRENAPALVGAGLGAGALSGFFGIGGGFLIVPGLVAATGLPMLQAVGTSLVAVTAFGLTAAASYAASGLVNWALAAVFVAGGAVGSLVGARAAIALSRRRGLMTKLFAGIILAVAAYMLARSFAAL